MVKKNKNKIELVKENIEIKKGKNYLAGLNLKSMLNRYKDSQFPEKTILIKMKLLNGFWTTFSVQATENKFKYKNATYIIDVDSLEYDINSKLWSLFYHQGLSIPLQLKFNLDDLKTSIIESGQVESTASVNPYIVDGFVESQVIEKLLKAEELTKEIQAIKTRQLWGLVGIAIILFLSVKGSGMF